MNSYSGTRSHVRLIRSTKAESYKITRRHTIFGVPSFINKDYPIPCSFSVPSSPIKLIFSYLSILSFESLFFSIENPKSDSDISLFVFVVIFP